MRRVWLLFAASLILVLTLSGLGCTVGPRRLAPVRFDYNQAISRSLDQQLLLNLVRLRYRDTPVFLELNTLVSQYSFSTSAGIAPTIVIGSEDEVANTTGISISETPTIGYAPLQGQEFAIRILSPIPPESIMLLSHSGWSIQRLLQLTVHEINSVRNAVRAAGPTPDTPPEFEAFQQLTRQLRELQLAGLLDVRLNPAAPNGSQVRLVFRQASSETQQNAIDGVKSSLGISSEVNDLRVVSTSGSNASDELVVRGRSFLAAMFFLSQGVVPPAAHVAEGKVTVTRDVDGRVFEWRRVVGDLLTIQSSSTQPEDAFVAIQYRNYWFYIDDADLNGKSTFNLLSYLFSLQAATGTGASPLLTLPAGR
jgi:hypothetical protein